MHPSDFSLLVRSDAMEAARRTSKPGSALIHKHSTFEALLYPIVILNQQGNICYMNNAARHLLAEGRDVRLAAHVRSHPDVGPISQLHFKLQNRHDLILKVQLGEIEWLGEKAVQVSISNVTPYVVMIQELQKEVAAPKQAPDPPAARQPQAEQPPAARAKEQKGARSLRENLDRATQENARLQSELARVTREHEESKKSLAAELEQARSELKLQAGKAAEASQPWETERASLLSSAAALTASLELAHRQTEAEAAQRRQAQADLEKARAAAAASEQVHSKLRQEWKALQRDLEQLTARAEEKSAQVAGLLEETKRLAQGIAKRGPRERELAAARDALQAELSAATAEREELRRESASLRQNLAAAEQARSQSAEAFEKMKGEAQSHAEALVRAREEAAQAAASAAAQQTEAAEAEKQAAAMARELKQVRGELSRSKDEAFVAEKARAQERAELGRRAQEGLEEAAAQTADELRSLRLKLYAEAKGRRVAQEKIAQFQQEMAGYRQTQENPAALHEAEKLIAKRVQGLAVAEERVRKLTEELRATRETHVEQEECVRKLRWLSAELNKKCEALAAEAQTRAQEQEMLQGRLREETAARQAAEAEIERLRQQPKTAKSVDSKSKGIDADLIGGLRQEVQAALKASAPHRLDAPAGPAAMMPRGKAAQRLP